MSVELLVVLVGAVLLSALARRYNLSSPLTLVVAGLIVGLIPGIPQIMLDPHLVLFVILPPLLWTAGLETSYVDLRKNIAAIGWLAVGLPIATTFVVGYVQRTLRYTYGSSYDAYCEAVPAWWPRLTPWRGAASIR